MHAYAQLSKLQQIPTILLYTCSIDKTYGYLQGEALK